MSIFGELYIFVILSALTVYLLVKGCSLLLNQFYYPYRYSEKHQRKLLLKTLENLGCTGEIGDDEIRAIYAGEHFVLQFWEKHLWIYYPYWGECDLSTTPQNEVTRLKECINLVNQNSAFHIVYTKEGNMLYLHSLIAVCLFDVLPNIVSYLKATFDALLKSLHLLQKQLIECNEQQTQERVKVTGFSTATTNDSADESEASPAVE